MHKEVACAEDLELSHSCLQEALGGLMSTLMKSSVRNHFNHVKTTTQPQRPYPMITFCRPS